MPESYNGQSTLNLPDHKRVLQALLKFFVDTPGVIGCYLSGSTATGRMDEDSDLDILPVQPRKPGRILPRSV